MLVFIDESGDPGFKVDKGSSPIFVTSMVLFDDVSMATATGERIKALLSELRAHPEFKFNKCSHKYRDAFFGEICQYYFRTRYVVVDKALIYSPALMTVKESFYKFFIKMMMKNDGGALKDAKVVIDGSGDRQFKQQLRTYIRKNVGAECVRKVDLKDSKRDPLVQLADMTAGAIARSYQHDKKHHMRWRNQLAKAGKIENVWNFK